MELCPYCSAALHKSSGQIYCSRKQTSFDHLEGGIFLLESGKLNSEEHFSRFAFRFHFSGEMNFEINNRSFVFNKPSILQFNYGSKYRLIINDKQIKTEHLGVAFQPTMLEEYFSSLQFSSESLLDDPYKKGKVYDHQPEYVTVNSDWKKLIRDLYSFTNDKSKAKDKNFKKTLLFNVLELYVKDKQQFSMYEDSLEHIKKSSTRKEILYRLMKANQYIQEAPLEELDLEKVASHACLSVYYFLRMFKIVFGKTPYQCILERKMSYARSLLLEDKEASIKDIAFRCHYYDSAAFIRGFKSYYQVTPRQMRDVKIESNK